jgi:MFS transporter, BCD family, chlorophyll transporter
MLRKQLQLALIHVAVAVTLVPIQSTLNRVMIKELAISATLVALFSSLPYLLSPIQVAIGSFADRHPIFGFRRTPYIILGLVCCVGGLALSPVAALTFETNWMSGVLLCLVAFGAWGMGYNFATVSYLSLASELSGPKGRSRTIAIMFFIMIVSIIFTAIGLSRLLEPYSHQILIESFWIVAGVALVLGLLGLIGLEDRSQLATVNEERHSWGEMVTALTQNRQVLLFFIYLVLMLAAILGQDVLLEPFAGTAFNMPINETTRITSIWGTGTLVCLIVAGLLEGRVNKRTVVITGSVGAAIAYGIIIASGMTASRGLFYTGITVLGLATGLATVSNLSLMLDMTTIGRVGLFMGAWGMANAFSRLTGNMLAGVVYDQISFFASSPVTGYLVVFAIEALMLVASLVILRMIDVSAFQRSAHVDGGMAGVVERAALAGD